MSFLVRLGTVLLCGAALSSCSYFNPNKDEFDPTAPVELTDFTEQFALERLWSVNIGAELDENELPLNPAILGGVVYVSDSRGRVSAIDASSGRRLWRADLDRQLTAGVTVTATLVLVGSQDGVVFALDTQNGNLNWRRRLTSEILAAPGANEQSVVVLTQDGKVHGLDSVTGEVRWTQNVQKPLLTLRGNSSPVLTQDTAYIGHDNGKLVAYRLTDGGVLWEARVAVPEGVTELERMVDVDAKPLIFSDLVFAASYQGGLMAINMENGRGAWFQEGSSRRDMAYYGGLLLVSMMDDRVVAYNATTGNLIWENSDFRNRRITAPVAGDQFVAVGEDEEGYLHLLNRRTGVVVGRRRVDSSGLVAAPLAVNDVIYVLGRGGRLQALRVEPR